MILVALAWLVLGLFAIAALWAVIRLLDKPHEHPVMLFLLTYCAVGLLVCWALNQVLQ